LKCHLLPQLLNSLLRYSAALASLPAAIWGMSTSLSRLASLSLQAGDHPLIILQHSRPSSFFFAQCLPHTLYGYKHVPHRGRKGQSLLQ